MFSGKPTSFPQMQDRLIECARIEGPWGAAPGIRLFYAGQDVQLSPGQMEALQSHANRVTSMLAI